MVERIKTTKIRQSPKMPAETRRQQLLDAAESLFKRRGYRSTTTEDIARKAGLTKGALYFHFKSKREITLELVKRAACKAIGDLEANIRTGMTLGEIFELLARVEVENHLDYYRQSLDFRHHAQNMPEIMKVGKQSHSQVVDIVARSLGPDRGRTHKQRKQVAIMVLSFFEGLMHFERVHAEIVDIKTELRLFESLFENKYMNPYKKR